MLDVITRSTDMICGIVQLTVLLQAGACTEQRIRLE